MNLMRKYLTLAASASSFLLAASSALAQTPVSLTAPQGAITTGQIKIENIPSFVINLLFSVGIIIAVAFLIYGGIKWILSGGDEKAVEAARNHIIAAIIGLIIVVGAFFILNIVFTLLTGSAFDFTHLCIPSLANGGKCN